MMPKTLVFDLDGTISDPFEGIFRSVNFALAAFDYPQVAAEDFKPFIGPPIDQTFCALTNAGDRDQILALVAKFRDRYARVGFSENVLYSNMHEILHELHQRGYTMGICTGKRADFAQRILEMFNIAALFSFVSGGDVGISKTQQISGLVEDDTIGATACMIGDRDTDVHAAQSSGLDTLGVCWGFGGELELVASGVQKIARYPRDLLDIFDQHVQP